MFSSKRPTLTIAVLCLFFSINVYGKRIYVAADAAAGGDGQSWATAYDDLHLALNAVNLAEGDEIWVKNGIYLPTTGTDRTITFNLKSGVRLLGGFDGSESMRAQRDSINTQTYLSGDIGTANDDSDNSHTILRITDAAASTLVSGLIITDGHADVNQGAMIEEKVGAGIFNKTTTTNAFSSPTLEYIQFLSNYATESGAALYSNCSGNLRITNCQFTGNTTSNSGGACYIGVGGPNKMASFEMSNNKYENNSSFYGGAIYVVANGGDVTYKDNASMFKNNAAVNGGSVGAAMYIFANDSTAFRTPSTTNIEIVNTIFDANNSSSSAGAYYALASNGGKSITDLINCTFANNTANVGAAVYLNESNNSEGVINIYNTIFWKNAASFNSNFNMSGIGVSSPTILVRNCLFEAADCEAVMFKGTSETFDCDGSSIFSGNPDFESSRGTLFGLGGTSDAVNNGDPAYLPGYISMDYTQVNRYFGAVDIGAYERQSLLPVESLHFNVYNREAFIQIEWATASELNNDYFVVERSADGRNFEDLEWVSGQGTTSEAHFYQIQDKNPWSGDNYYRLRQVDFDGTTTYSDIRIVKRDSEKVLVYPNPVEETLYLSMSQFKTGEVDFFIHNMTGQTMLSGQTTVNEGIVIIPLEEVQNFQAGAYFISISSGQRPISSTKFMKIKH